MFKLGYLYVFNPHCFGRSKLYFLSSGARKIKVLRGYCRDDGPNLCIGFLALFSNMDASEEK